MTRVTAKQLVELIQGKELSTTEIFAAVKAAYPANTMTRQELVIRLRSMIISPDVKIIKRGRGATARYKLISATDRFLERAEVNYHASTGNGIQDKTLWHFNSLELRFCHIHKMFDQALAGVRGEYVA